MSAPLTLKIGERNLTDSYDSLSFSNVSPGGYEQLQATSPDAGDISEGDEVTVRSGLDVAWHGRVNEAGRRDTDGRTITQIAALGNGAKLTDERMQAIYADRDLTHWTPMSRARRVSLLGSAINVGDPSMQPDPTSGLPSLNLEIDEPSTRRRTTEALYDGQGCNIDSIYYDIDRNNISAAGWGLQFYLGDNADLYQDASTNLAGGAGVTVGTYNPATNRLFAHIQLDNNTGVSDTATHFAMCRLLAVYGDHGLTKRGTAPEGFYPGDIAAHALTASGAGFILIADDSSGLTVRHSVYRDHVPHQQIIDDMSKLMGWHWGVWEPRTTLDDTPTLYFIAPPEAATCSALAGEIRDLDAPRVRVDLLYDTANVKWTDAAGTAGVATVTIANPLTVGAGVAGRTLDLDMGVGDATSATAYGTFALNLALTGARGGGFGTLPGTVRAAGGRKPACLLKAGRDKIRILDLPDSGPVTAQDSDRLDSFLVRRVETTVDRGTPSTRIEFDGGADLLEVLQARLALAQFG